MTESSNKNQMQQTNGQHKKGQRDGKRQGRGPTQHTPLSSDASVPLLQFGASNNFKKKVSIMCIEKYKSLGRLIIDEAYHQPPDSDLTLYDLMNIPHDIEKGN
jgi:hypothetical protein